jgi:hypothetical protein
MPDVCVLQRRYDYIIRLCGAMGRRGSIKCARRSGGFDGTPDGCSRVFPPIFEGKLLFRGEGLPCFGKLVGKSSDLLEWRLVSLLSEHTGGSSSLLRNMTAGRKLEGTKMRPSRYLRDLRFPPNNDLWTLDVVRG